MALVEWITVLSRALLDQAGDPPPPHHLALLAGAPLPIAVLRPETHEPIVASTLWRAMFKHRPDLPAALREGLLHAYRNDAMHALRDVPIAAQPCQVVIQPVHFTATSRGLVAACTPGGSDDLADTTQRHMVLLDRLLVALDEAEQANRAKDSFLAMVSHELRAPVTTIMLWENVLRDHLDEPPLRLRALDAIRESANAQARLVGDLLDISRAISGKLSLDRHRIAIETVLTACLDAALPAASAKQITLETAIRSRLGRVLADASRLRQVFDNLLSNAVKFTPPGGCISVDARRDRSAVIITITDTGHGIEPQLLERLFTPFARHEVASTRSEGGLGLGLAIAKQLVDLHQGTITAASAGRERGATFKVTLPLVQQRTTTPRPGAIQALPRLDRVRVLIIDDEPQVRDGIDLLLRKVGATVVAAGSASEARNLLGRMRPDVVICDIAMPVEDGYTFIRALRDSNTRAAGVPAIALTAYASQRDRDRAAGAGFDMHLAKPVRLHDLTAAIQSVLSPRG